MTYICTRRMLRFKGFTPVIQFGGICDLLAHTTTIQFPFNPKVTFPTEWASLQAGDKHLSQYCLNTSHAYYVVYTLRQLIQHW